MLDELRTSANRGEDLEQDPEAAASDGE
jgi:hypothetical protein